MSTRRNLKPGDIVVEFAIHNNRPRQVYYALVIGVKYPRDGHQGCEERIQVMWSNPIHFDEICDCGVVSVEEFLRSEA